MESKLSAIAVLTSAILRSDFKFFKEVKTMKLEWNVASKPQNVSTSFGCFKHCETQVNS